MFGFLWNIKKKKKSYFHAEIKIVQEKTFTIPTFYRE